MLDRKVQKTHYPALNSTYDIPLNLLVLLHTISFTSRTFPTLDIKSSKSLALKYMS